MARLLLAMFLLRLAGAGRSTQDNNIEISELGSMTEVTMENLQKTQLLLEAEIRELHEQKDTLAAENVKLKADIAKLKGGTLLEENDQEEKQVVEAVQCCKWGLSCTSKPDCKKIGKLCCAGNCAATGVGGCRR
mmetsp:Transcript_90201/g.179465  ORF Transcript_90201/g.179465 Transcript_90201/m.179465 type:complete len:134 (-) Transcript_90201:120-521(-)